MESPWPTTGPAKNLIEFACRAKDGSRSLPPANVMIATFRRGTNSTENEFVQACKLAGLETHIIQERFLFDLAVIPEIRRLVSLCKPDIVQSHAVKSHFLVRLTGINRGRHWIAFQHGYTWPHLKMRMYNYLDRWSLRAASKVVTVCQTFADDLEKIGVCPKRIVIQHNSVNPFFAATNKEISDLRQTLGISSDSKVVLCVGRFSREKAQKDLIQAVALLRRENLNRNIKCVFAGDGPDLQILKDAARFFGIEDWLIFPGRVSDLRPFYTMANLFVLPSHTEGSPNVLLEAMAAGLPIIATAVGGVPEIVRNEEEALLVEKQNPKALAQAIARVLDDNRLQRQLAETARRRIQAYSPAVYCQSILALYRSCLENTELTV